MIPIDKRSKMIVETVVFIKNYLPQTKVLDMSTIENDSCQKVPWYTSFTWVDFSLMRMITSVLCANK